MIKAMMLANSSVAIELITAAASPLSPPREKKDKDQSAEIYAIDTYTVFPWLIPLGYYYFHA